MWVHAAGFSRMISMGLLAATLLAPGTLAQAPSTPSATPENANRQVEELKERLATKVAELKNFRSRAIFGSIHDVSIASITIEAATKQVKIDLTDELSIIQYIRGKRTLLSVDDLDVGDIVTVFGAYDESLDLLQARALLIQGPLPTIVSGRVREIDRTDFTLKMVTDDSTEYIVDIETTTATQHWSSDVGLVKSGFSKVRVGETLHIVGSALDEEGNRFSANRILDIGFLETPTPEVTPQTTPETP